LYNLIYLTLSLLPGLVMLYIHEYQVRCHILIESVQLVCYLVLVFAYFGCT